MTKKLLIALLIVIVSASVVTSFIVLGSPAEERVRRMDDQRVQELDMISSAIDGYWSDAHQLPDSLEIISTSRLFSVQSIQDPQTGEKYVYEPAEDGHYTLCATFEAVSDTRIPIAPPKISMRDNRNFWNHPDGYTCFEITAQDWNSPTPPPVLVR
ncbi:MAG: hypothetical protein NUV81_00970 [bacterium]|nr:hypothetical protein [bacterium]